MNKNTIIIISIAIVIVITILSVLSYLKSREPFEENITPKYDLILYYADWCGASQSFLPEWAKIETYLSQHPEMNTTSKKINCIESNKEVCKNAEIEYFPTIFLYKNKQKFIKFDDDKKRRNMNNIIQFILENNK